MHIALPISNETILMGADLIDSSEETFKSKSGFSLYVNADNKPEARRLFAALSDEGIVIVPIADQLYINLSFG